MSSHRVLFADPDPQVLRALERIFEDLPQISICTATNAEDALALARAQDIDLFVADRMVGSEKAKDLLVELHDRIPTASIILLTDQPPKRRQELLDALDRQIPVLDKPWDTDALRQAVLDALGTDVEAANADPLLLYTNLTEKNLERARRIMNRMERQATLGEVLIDLGEITAEQYQEVLSKQRSRLDLIDLLLEDKVVDAAKAEKYRAAKAAEPKADDYELLVGDGIIKEADYLKALAEKIGTLYVEPDINAIHARFLQKSSTRYLLRQCVLPVDMVGDKLQVLVSRPQTTAQLAELTRIFGKPVTTALSCSDQIREALRTLDRLKGGKGDRRDTSLKYRVIEDQKPGEDQGDEAVQIVDYLLLRAIQIGASDLHIEPMQNRMRVRARVDGRLQPVTELPKDSIARVVSRVKVLAGADISERRLHQDGKIMVMAEGGEVDIRVSSYVSQHGETMVLRLLHRSRGLLTLDQLDFTPRIRTLIEEVVIPASSGMLVLTGPTGSGKTTTLYSFVQQSMDPEEKIITAEDPVEYMTDGIIQCSVNEKTGPTFADSLRAMMRQDPDSIIVGEMRDGVTASLAFEAALTGHKVYTTFHTDDSVTVVIRLLEMGLEPFLISSTLSTVIAQRLMRRLCPDCKAPQRPDGRELRFLGLERPDLDGMELFGAKGCSKCNDTGYRGRLGIHEFLVPDDDFRDAILQKASSKSLRQLATKSSHFLSLQEDALLKALRGSTSLAEMVATVPRDPHARSVQEIKAIAGRRKS